MYFAIMKDSNLDLFDPATALMESADYSPTSSEDRNFAFAFDNSSFSDRVLQIEVLVDDSPGTHSGSDACLSLVDWARYRKRPREDVKRHNGTFFFFFRFFPLSLFPSVSSYLFPDFEYSVC